ncbi:uncharacterized protein LOC132758003 [Ruditapes philippinarum]|uniref:uncharacterized protein LOC132758003 n=1 Tax=Ruditapes philippinarum TaxID=129788 RepID=UPI00295B1CE2|nr:uncharacterized protein LOC132758003 [Ruditapes philippinarum]
MVLFQISFLLFLALPELPLSLVRGENDAWNQNVEYFEKVDLDCAKFYKHSAVIHSVKAWIMPSSDVWLTGSDTDVKDGQIAVRNNGFLLSIARLDDEDFGVYYCIVDTGVNGTQVVKIGINVDGPYYGPELTKELKHDAMVGGIAAGCALVLFIILWLLCAYCTETPPPPSIVFIKDNQNIPEKETKTENMQMTKIGDSVYYNADEVTSQQEPIVKEEPKSETLSSTNSGYYHSIDSIDRKTNQQNIDPADVYM